jgi:sulfite exporter TauE/SafE/copper chaperone CopZ
MIRKVVKHLKKIYIKIEGMTCDHCKNTVTNVLLKESNVKSVVFDGNIAEVEFTGKFNKDIATNSIVKANYYTNINMISENKRLLKKTMSKLEFFNIVAVIILLAFMLNSIFGFNIFNMIPVIDSRITLVMLFFTGLLTSIHCVSMCGTINLVASKSITRNFKKPILYNLGRLTSYTIIGGIVGLLGSILTINAYVQGFIILLAAVAMLFMGLNMMGVTNFSLNFKNPIKAKGRSSYVIGLLNGLMPCGPLQAMQVYALSTGSFMYGALSMFLFCLGTIPLMLFVGMISNFLNNKNRITLNKISTVLILILSLVMFNRGLLGIRTVDILFNVILFLLFRKLEIIPTNNIKGIVPKQNKNIDNAPYINEPVDNAYTCIA